MSNSSARVVVDVGTVIAETYRIEALVGRGGMGSVFLATHARLPGKQVAIKLLHADLQDDEVIARFKREAEITSRLGHPNIVGVHDFNVMSDGTPYLVLEYLQGESLAARLRQGPLPLETVFSITRQVGSALAAAHREGIVHRDLKPQNIFLCPTEVDGKLVEIAKVLDFGISKMRGSTTVKTLESTLLGTPQYMAPEQAKGDHANVDQRTDVFALGSIVYEMLAGHAAFSGDNIPEICFKVVYEQPRPLLQEAPSAPSSVVDSVAQAMAKVPDERFSSVNLFIEKLTGEKVMPPPSRSGISLPPSDSPATGQDAFAKTRSSGEFDIAASTPRPRLPTPIPVELDKPANPQGATVDSLAQLAPPRAASRPTEPPKRSLAPILGIAIASAVAGAVVLYLVTRGGSNTDAAVVTPDAAVVVVAPPDAAVVTPDAAVIAAAPLDAADVAEPVATPDAAAIADAAQLAIADAAAVIADAAPRVADAAITRTPPDASRTADLGTKGAYLATLDQASRAVASRDWATAGQLAGTVIVSDDATIQERMRARSLSAIVHCVGKFDEEGAGLDLKQIPAGYRGLRKAALDACHAAGYLKQTPQ